MEKKNGKVKIYGLVFSCLVFPSQVNQGGKGKPEVPGSTQDPSPDRLSEQLSRTVFSRTFSIVLRPSRDIPACSRPLSRIFLAIPIRSVSFRCHLICPVTRPFRVPRLIPSLSSFLLVFLQFSILGSDRSESGSLFSHPFTFLFSHNSVFR